MSFVTIDPATITSGSSIKAELFQTIKSNLDDLDVRLAGASIEYVTAENYIANQTTSILQISTEGTFTSYLPDAALNEGIIVAFKKVSTDAYDWTIAGISDAYIDNLVDYTMTIQYDSATMISDGINWFIVNKIDSTNIVPITRRIDTTAPLTGGGNLSTNRILSLSNVTNTEIAADAAIPYSKLNLTSGIVNNDIVASAGIPYSKLNLSNSIVNGDIVASAGIPYSKLNLSNSIVNADIKGTTDIDWTKMAPLSTSKAVVTDGSGVITTSATTATELTYLIGVTSSIQDQLDDKQPNYNVDVKNTVNRSWDTSYTTILDFGAGGSTGGLIVVTIDVNATTPTSASYLLIYNNQELLGLYPITTVKTNGSIPVGTTAYFELYNMRYIRYKWTGSSPAGFTSTDITSRNYSV